MEFHLSLQEREWLNIRFRNHVVIHRRISVGQTRLTFRKRTQGPKVLAFLFSSIRKDEKDSLESTRICRLRYAYMTSGNNRNAGRVPPRKSCSSIRLPNILLRRNANPGSRFMQKYGGTLTTNRTYDCSRKRRFVSV